MNPSSSSAARFSCRHPFLARVGDLVSCRADPRHSTQRHAHYSRVVQDRVRRYHTACSRIVAKLDGNKPGPVQLEADQIVSGLQSLPK